MIKIFFELSFFIMMVIYKNSNKSKDKYVNFRNIKHKIVNFAVA